MKCGKTIVPLQTKPDTHDRQQTKIHQRHMMAARHQPPTPPPYSGRKPAAFTSSQTTTTTLNQ